MIKRAFLTAFLAAAAANAFAHDTAGRPETDSFAPHITGTTGDGRPDIHRPAASTHDGASSGIGTMRGGAGDSTVTYSGQPRGSLGFPQAGRVVDSEDGRPVIEHGHRPAGAR